jgi:biopolymer transport protein ExbB
MFLTLSMIGGEGILYLILVLSVVSITVIIERFLYFRCNRSRRPGFEQQIFRLLKARNREEALKLVDTERGPEARSLKQALSSLDEGVDEMEQAFSNQIAREQMAMEKRLLILGTLGNNTPFIGLLGTVLGIIKAFHDLSVTQASGPQVVMSGIAEALIATALGLFVAIPAVIAYNFFQRQSRVTRQKLDVFANTALYYVRPLVTSHPGEKNARSE